MTYLPKIKLLPLFLIIIVLLIQINVSHATTVLASNLVASPADSSQMNGSGIGIYQCFQPIQTGQLTDATFDVRWTDNGGSQWFINYNIYSTTGAYGSTCSPTGSVLALSGSINVRTLPANIFQVVNLLFTGSNQITLIGGTTYALVATYVSGSGTNVFLGVGTDTYAGNSGNCQPTCNPAAADLDFVIDGITASSLSFNTQCIGNGGIPCITLANTNSTHSINFNQSITLLYIDQAGLTGTWLNQSVNVAKSYSNGMQVILSSYIVSSCPAGNVPFTSQCPGSQITQKSFLNPSKGQLTLPINIGITSGVFVGLAVSANFAGLDLNDTNAAFTSPITGSVYYTQGISPAIISSASKCISGQVPCGGLASSSKMGLWGFIIGATIVTVTPPNQCNQSVDLACFLIASVTSLSPSNPVVGGVVYLIAYFVVTVFIVTFFMHKFTPDMSMPGIVWLLLFLTYLSMFVALGLLPVYIIIVEILIVSLLFGGMISGKLRGQLSE